MPFLSPAPPFTTSEDQTEVKNIREPTTQYLLLDSKDRNQNTQGLGPVLGQNEQPWNNFRLQKPEALMTAFARRIEVSEIRFPWFIPNITDYNNTIWVSTVVGSTPGPAYALTLSNGFRTPAQIVTALNLLLAALYPAPPPTFSYDSVSQRYTFSVPSGSTPGTAFILTNVTPGSGMYADYYSKPSLYKTLGFQGVQLISAQNPGQSLTGNSTNSSYTDYVDIVSDKLMTYTDVRDGSSTNGGQSSLIARIYANDEVSIPATQPITCAPFYIHRQFKNAKNIKWNPEAVIDWCDISVYDMWGNLVWLPPVSLNVGAPPPVVKTGEYPNFQITLLASEQ
jgi:hypothetical protein